MEEILVLFYNNRTCERGTSTVFAYSLTEAIEIVRHSYDYKIFILSVKYANMDKVINKL